MYTIPAPKLAVSGQKKLKQTRLDSISDDDISVKPRIRPAAKTIAVDESDGSDIDMLPTKSIAAKKMSASAKTQVKRADSDFEDNDS